MKKKRRRKKILVQVTVAPETMTVMVQRMKTVMEVALRKVAMKMEAMMGGATILVRRRKKRRARMRKRKSTSLRSINRFCSL